MSEGRTLCRMRLVFSRGEAIKYVGHLDLMRAWERILRRAGVPLAYSQGFNPHPRLTLAMPLPVGCTGEREELDFWLTEPRSPESVVERLRAAMPTGLDVIEVRAVDLHAPARPACIQRADYRVTLNDMPVEQVRRAVGDLLARQTVMVDLHGKRYDLRPLIDGVSVEEQNGVVFLDISLLRDAQGRIGRPDALIEALGLGAHVRSVHRLGIFFDA